MKGSNKKFARYLKSEYYDDYLEAAEEENPLSLNDHGHNYTGSQRYIQAEQNPKTYNRKVFYEQSIQTLSNEIKQPERNLVSKFDIPRIPLANDLIRDFASVLGSEALRFYNHLNQIKTVKDARIFEVYRDMYDKFETVPVLFLSVIPNEAVYLWQINRKCPYQEGTKYMVLDSKDLSLETRRHISILMLAKITSTEKEKLLGAELVDDRKLVVRVKVGPRNNQIAIKVYEIKNFVKTTRVNPYKYAPLANNRYSDKLLIKGFSIDKEHFLKVCFFKKEKIRKQNLEKIKYMNERYLGEQTGAENAKSITLETLKETRVIRDVRARFKVDQSTFSKVFNGEKDSSLLIDKNYALVLMIKDDSFLILNYGTDSAKIESIFEVNGNYYLVNVLNKVFEIKLKDFSKYESEQNNFDLYSDMISQNSWINKTYEIALYDQIPTIFYLSSNSIDVSRLKKNPDSPIQVDLKGKYAKNITDKFAWTVYYSRKAMILTILNGTIFIYDLQEEQGQQKKGFDIPNAVTSETWEIIRSGEQTYILGLLNGFLYHLIKVNVDGKSGLSPSFSLIGIEKNRYATGYSNVLSNYHIEGSHKQILLIPFRCEPLYIDTENFMYSDSVFLFNPYGEVNSDSDSAPQINREDKEEKERIFLEKIIIAKNAGINHVEDTRKGIEETNEALKEIRREITSRIKEPEGVDRESLRLFQEIKKEKKKIQKEKQNKKINYKEERTEKYGI